jgi:hypothetical protein
LAAAPLITIEQFNALMRAEIPLSTFLGITALEVGAGSAVLRLPFTPAALRPGGAQSGPALMALADLAMYAAVMGLYGNEPRVLSSDLSMNFLCSVAAASLASTPSGHWRRRRLYPKWATEDSFVSSQPIIRCLPRSRE